MCFLKWQSAAAVLVKRWGMGPEKCNHSQIHTQGYWCKDWPSRLLLRPHWRRWPKVPRLRPPPMGFEKGACREEVRSWAEIHWDRAHAIVFGGFYVEWYIYYLFALISLFYLCSSHRWLWLADNIWSDYTPDCDLTPVLLTVYNKTSSAKLKSFEIV
jgi:hypothetical protein